jgi:hypothetical protein
MMQKLNLNVRPASLVQRMIAGAGIGLIVITFFVLVGADKARPEWGKLWMIRPLIVVPVAGAVGGVCFAYIDNLRLEGWRRILAATLSVIVFIFGLWLGTILGLSGTLWD